MSNQTLPRDPNGFPSGSGYAPSVGVLPAELDTSRINNDGTEQSAPYLVTITNPVTGSVTTSANLTSVAGSTTSIQLLGASARKTFFVYNDSSSSLYLAYGNAASTSAYTVKIAAGSYYEMPSSIDWQGAVFGIWDSATGFARITEVS